MVEEEQEKKLLEAIQNELPRLHIEHLLSQIGDYASIAERCETDDVKIGGNTFSLKMLQNSYAKILKSIADTIRWGYRPQNGEEAEKIGTSTEPLVTVDEHIKFVAALL